jgi:LuxR family quorum sensing-dependent transcriptional regulator
MPDLHAYGERILDFVEQLQTLQDYEAISVAFRIELEWFGLSCIKIFAIPRPGIDPTKCVLINGRPDASLIQSLSENLKKHDPAMPEFLDHVGPTWGEVWDRYKLAKSQRRLPGDVTAFDIADGIVISMMQRDGSKVLMSFSGRESNLPSRARSAIKIIATYAQEALQNAHTREARDIHLRLSAREREVMVLVATGKTDDEIGKILSIRRETVTCHVENAKLKLNASRRTFAIVQALRQGEISL